MKFEKVLKVKIELLQEMLGTNPADPEIYGKFIASKAPDAMTRAEEVAAYGADAVMEKNMTVFLRDKEGRPYIPNYHIKGFFKDSCGALQRCKGAKCAKESSALKAYKKIIDGCIFVQPRELVIDMRGGKVGNCQRPLRGQTPQGERIALANSETVPEGSTLEFKVQLVSDKYEPAVREWLDYGESRGLGQWRNSGKGSFKVLSIEEEPQDD